MPGQIGVEATRPHSAQRITRTPSSVSSTSRRPPCAEQTTVTSCPARAAPRASRDTVRSIPPWTGGK